MAALANAPYWYIGSTKWSAVTAWAASTAKTAGALIRQSGTPTLGDERVFVCIVAGTTSGSQPSWVVTKGAKTTDNSITWQECTGQPAVNGDATNTKDWNSAKSNTVALGQIIKNIAASHYFICTTAGTSGSGAEPTWNTTAGQTTADNTVTWTSLGAVGNFGAWAAPHQRIPNAVATNWGTHGDTFYASNNHAESQNSGWTATLVGSKTAPSNYVCVTDTAAPPTAVNSTATVTTTSGNMILNGSTTYCYVYGINFYTASTYFNEMLIVEYEQCSFNTTGSSGISLSNDAQANNAVFRDCAFTFGSTSGTIGGTDGAISIIGGSVAATGSVPTTPFTSGSGANGSLTVRDCNLSAITGTLVDISLGTAYSYMFSYCRLGSGVTLSSGTVSAPGTNTLRVHMCDSGATNYRMYTQAYTGTSQHDTGVYNDNGATDGTTHISWKVITNSAARFWLPFQCEQIFQWVDTTGSALTATVEIAGSSSLTDGDIWMELEYLGNASYPLGSTVDCRKADILASNTTITSSSATWTGSPATKQKMQVTFTPQMKGPIKARIYVAKASTTVYIDPLITVA